MSYYNTTHQSGAQVLRYRRQAQTQDQQLLEFFEANPRQLYTPSELLLFVFESAVPITSVRRAVSTLTERGQLVKTDRQKPGPYGRPEYAWRLATGQLELL